MQKITSTIFVIAFLTSSRSHPLGNGEVQIFAGGDLLGQSSKPTPDFKSHGRERAILEMESKLSQLDSKYGYAQNFIGGFNNVQPLVDTIHEYEKYGNDGGKSRRVSQGFINVIEGISNIGNTVIDVPQNQINYLSRAATAKLNSIGASLWGL